MMLEEFKNPAALVRLAVAFLGSAIAAQLMYPFSGPVNPSWQAGLIAESSAFFLLALALVAASASMTQIAAVWLAGLLGIADGVIARAVYDFFLARGDHNLLPFELIFAAAFAFPGALVGSLVGLPLRFIGRRKIRVP
jgi:hypothetical protein